MRISDWSSDVCSSDLGRFHRAKAGGADVGRMPGGRAGPRGRRAFPQDIMAIGAKQHRLAGQRDQALPGGQRRIEQRSERGAAAVKGRRPCRREEAGKKAEPKSEEHTSKLQSLMRISYAVSCLK